MNEKSGRQPTYLDVPRMFKKRLVSGYYNPNIPHLEVGYNQFTIQLLTSWDLAMIHFDLLKMAGTNEQIYQYPKV